MLEMLLGAITALGTAGAQNVLTSAGESAVKHFKDSHAWKKLIVGTGDFFIKNEREENSFFEDLELVLSKDNLCQIAKDLKTEDGYLLKQRLYKSLMQLMNKYEIPYEVAESYTMRIIYAILEQLKSVDPIKYEHYFLQEWREEQERNFQELQKRLEKMTNDIAIFSQEEMTILSSGQMDLNLRKSTQNPQIGIEFFTVDDQRFQEEFEERRHEELVYVRGRSREETIYCILNELWRLDEKRPIYVVKSLDSWNKLHILKSDNNIYIPWFYADEIIAIENNTNIFVLEENTPAFNRNVIEMRPRTRNTLLKCLNDAGMEYDKAYTLLKDTHGLYIPMKKKLFRGECLKLPAWLGKIGDRVKKICLLIGGWEETDGDKLIIESLYGDTYEHFLETVLPFTKGEEPFLCVIKHNGMVAYCLASTENTWSYLDVSMNEKIWELFIEAVLEVFNESENLFTYDSREKLMAQFKGERLFWSETLRKGMLKTLMMKGAYEKDCDTQLVLDRLVEQIFGCVKNEKQWIYISEFWLELCEIAPTVVLERLHKEIEEDTGLLELFQNQTSDFIFGRNAYINILWGIEQFLVQKDYFWMAFRWLLKLDSMGYEFKSNSPKDILSKVFCTWLNFSTLQTAKEKIIAAKKTFELDYCNAWYHLYAAIDNKGRSMIGELYYPKYREHEILRTTTMGEMRDTYLGYLDLLIKHMDFSVEHWEKMLHLSTELPEDLKDDVFDQLLYEIHQMSDDEVMIIKNSLRSLIYRHSYFSSSSWTMSKDKVCEYEELLNRIHINTPEYEYSYLFLRNGDYPLLHPVPYDKEGEREDNENATQEVIQEKLKEFQDNGYSIAILAKICAREPYNTLGTSLAKYWNDGKWNFNTFKELLTVQESGAIAIDYLAGTECGGELSYSNIIAELSNLGCSDELLAKIYRVEATKTKEVPIVTNSPESIKKEFWKACIFCEECNFFWAIEECKKYAVLDVYLDQLHQIHYRKPLAAEVIFACLENIEEMPRSLGNQMTGYHVEQLLSVLQEAYMDKPNKCMRIAHLEILFMNLLDWKNMKCFRHIIKQSPELMAQIVSVVFKHDHGKSEKLAIDEAYVQNMYTIYDKAQFCPAEREGEVPEDQLEQWVVKYRDLLIQNDQESMIGITLGRLFSFAPIGDDGHEPCDSVRKMIEKFGDEKMISHYQTAVYNRRGVYSPSAGREELRIAEEFKANAKYLEPHYPKTAKIFYGLYETYKQLSETERKEAEYGWH